MAFDPHTTTLVVARVPTPLPQQQHQQQTNCLTLSALSMQHSSRATSGQVTLPSLRHVADVDDGLPSARSLLPLPMAAGCGIVLVQQRAGSWPVCAWSLTPSSSSPSSQAAQAGSHSGCSLVVDTAQDTSVQGADCESVCGAVVPHAGTSPAGVSPSAGVLLGVLPGTIPDVHVLALAIGPCTAVKHTSTPSRQGLSTHQPGTAGRESDTRSQPQFHGTATAVALHANHHVCIWELNLGSVLRSTLLACVDTAPAPAALLTPIGMCTVVQGIHCPLPVDYM